MVRFCRIESCERFSRSCGFCDTHYRRSRLSLDLDKIGDNSLWGSKNKKRTTEQRKRISDAKRGKPGHKHTEEHKRYMSELQHGSHNGMWRGNNITYKSLHQWVNRNISRPESCPNCGSISRLDGCNISGEYRRDPADWEYLCRLCHHRKYHNKDSPFYQKPKK